jgi:hypothetical protein
MKNGYEQPTYEDTRQDILNIQVYNKRYIHAPFWKKNFFIKPFAISNAEEHSQIKCYFLFLT